MSDNIDKQLYQYFENISVPKKLDDIIERTIQTKEYQKRKKYNQYLLKVASLFIIFVISGSIVFAKNIVNSILEIFTDTHQGIVKAIENGYIADIDMEYIYSNELGIRVNTVIMDDYNLCITFRIQTEKNIDNINYVELPDLVINDEKDNLIFCSYNNVKGYEAFCKKNHIIYNKNNMQNNYTNNGYATEIISKSGNEIVFALKMYSSNYPRSEKLYMNFKKIMMGESKENVSRIKNGIWKMEIELPKEFYNREVIYYTVKDRSDIENKLKVMSATISDTEMNIYFTNIVNNNENVESKDITMKVENRIEELLKGKNKFYDDIEVENEKGEIFKRSQTSDAGGTIYSMDGSIKSLAKFTLTKYDVTDVLKVRITRKSETIIINLNRK